MDEDLPRLTDAQVQIGALPGESWEAARHRLETERLPDIDVIPSWIEDRRPAYLQPRAALPKMLTALRFAELQAFWQMTDRERFNLRKPGAHWPTYAELVSDLSAADCEWSACAERLPDYRNSALRYLVHTPSDQWLTCCRYVGEGMWSRVSDNSLLSGARHWRVALYDQPGSRPVTRAECYALARLSRRHKLPPFDEEQDDRPWPPNHLLNRVSR